jgi:DNA-binding transcriptional LysR family regulator
VQIVEHSAANQHYDMFIMAINAAMSGLGVALLPRILIERELRSGALVQVHPHSIPNPETVYYSFPEQKRDWEPLRRFDQWLVAAVCEYREGCQRDSTAAFETSLASN